MAKFERFEDILAWQKGRDLVNELYNIVEGNPKFMKDYELKSQLFRASYSIMLNIVEGFGRRTNKEFINFLVIAHGSSTEIQSALYIVIDRKYIDETLFHSLNDKCDQISKMIMGLIKYLRND